jgi:hypothetical protein
MRTFLAALALAVVAGAIWFGIRKPAPETVAVKSEDKPAPRLLASSPALVPEATVPPLLSAPSETEAQRLDRIKRFGDLPYEKWLKVQAIVFDYMQLFTKFSRDLDPSEGLASTGIARWQAQNILKRERRADLAAAGLTPDEITECELHVLGHNLLDSLKDVITTADERWALYRAWDTFQTENRSWGSFSAPEMAVRERAWLANYEQARVILGAERFAIFLQRDDLAYRRFAQLADDLGRPADIADQLWRLKSELIIRRGELPQFDSDRESFLRQSALLNAEIRARIGGLVGEDALEKNPWAFEQWMPKAKPPSPKVSPPAP